MLSLILRNLFFTILQPGIVAGLIPYLILRSTNSFEVVWTFNQYAGIFLFFIGLVIMLHCVAMFAIKGKGTLSPADPTKKLVIKGLYRFSRNPMYVGVMVILIGECIFSLSIALLVYSFFILLAFILFVVFVEEPRLSNSFGEEYREYCLKVRRWF